MELILWLTLHSHENPLHWIIIGLTKKHCEINYLSITTKTTVTLARLLLTIVSAPVKGVFKKECNGRQRYAIKEILRILPRFKMPPERPYL